MFKKHTLQMSLVKNPKVDTSETTKTTRRLNDPEIALIKSVAKSVGVFAVLSAVTLKFSDAICEIAVNYAPKN